MQLQGASAPFTSRPSPPPAPYLRQNQWRANSTWMRSTGRPLVSGTKNRAKAVMMASCSRREAKEGSGRWASNKTQQGFLKSAQAG